MQTISQASVSKFSVSNLLSSHRHLSNTILSTTDNAEAVYARAASNLRVVTEVIPTKFGHTAQFCAMIVVQDKVSTAQDHIVTVKLKSKPASDRLMALQDLLAETELGVHKLLGGLEVGKPARFEYDPPA